MGQESEGTLRQERWQRNVAIPTFFRMLRFGLVGVLATATHALVALTALTLFSAVPMLANAVGFVTAFAVSMTGHALFTFNSPMTVPRALKFCAVAIAAVCISSAVVFLLGAYTPLSRPHILILAAISTPALSFAGHSLWTFRKTLG